MGQIIPEFTFKNIMIDDFEGTIIRKRVSKFFKGKVWAVDWYEDNSHYSDNEIDVSEFKGSIYGKD